MVIKRSSAREIDALIADLEAGIGVRREAAAARLAVIGARAVGRLLDVVRDAGSAGARVAALQALEPAGDSRSLEAALACLGAADTAVAVQAVSLARTFLASAEGPRAIDRLAALAVDAARPPALRLAALEALADMPARTVQPIWRRLADDSDPSVRRRSRRALGLDDPEPEPGPSAVLDAAAAGSLPGSPAVLKAAVAAAGAEAPLPTLHGTLEAVRRLESRGDEWRDAPEWRQVRGVLHRTLAERGSTVALYDLRETIERATGPLPADFVAALAMIGDRTCLDAMAAAFTRTLGGPAGHDWWRTHLAGAFQEIVRREGLTGRHAALRQVRAKWPEAATALLGPRRR